MGTYGLEPAFDNFRGCDVVLGVASNEFWGADCGSGATDAISENGPGATTPPMGATGGTGPTGALGNVTCGTALAGLDAAEGVLRFCMAYGLTGGCVGFF